LHFQSSSEFKKLHFKMHVRGRRAFNPLLSLRPKEKEVEKKREKDFQSSSEFKQKRH